MQPLGVPGLLEGICLRLPGYLIGLLDITSQTNNSRLSLFIIVVHESSDPYAY
jgi:hypothetical protein